MGSIPLALFMNNGVVARGIKWFAQRPYYREPRSFECRDQHVVDRLDVGRAMREGAVTGIEHRQQPLDEPCCRLLDDFGMALLGLATEVGEIRGDAPGVVEIPVAFFGHSLEIVEQ